MKALILESRETEDLGRRNPVSESAAALSFLRLRSAGRQARVRSSLKCEVKITLMGALILLALAVPLSVSCQEFRLVGEIEFPKRDVGYSVRVKRSRPVTVSTEIASRTGAPVIAVTMRHDVWYLDGSNLEVIRRLSFSDDEVPAISKNGRYLSVFWEIANRRTGKRLQKVRVENDRGVRLWEMGFLGTAMLEPSPTGGFVAYPNLHPDDAALLDGFATYRHFEPPWKPHGLLVFNSDGDLVLEGIDHREHRAWYYTGELAGDGRYLALAFDWVPPENRETRAKGGDKGCLAFFDIEKGVELWRLYFDGVRFPELEISSEAERVICFVSTSGEGYLDAGDFHLCLIDFEGRLLLDKSIEGCRGWLNGPRNLKLSPNGRFFAFTTRDHGLHVFRAADGSAVWERVGDQDGLKPHDFGVNSDGSILALVGGEDGGAVVRKLVQTDGRGETRTESQLGSGFPRGKAVMGPVGDSGFYWVMAGRRLMLYELQ